MERQDLPGRYLAHQKPDSVNILVTTNECYLLTGSLTAGRALRAVGPGPTFVQHRLHPPGLAVLHLAARTCTHSKLRRRRTKGDCSLSTLEEEEQMVTAHQLQWLQPQQTEKKKKKSKE